MQVPITLSTKEFTQRWSEHVQPDHLPKVRYFGGWSNSKASHYRQSCDVLSPVLDETTTGAGVVDDASSQPAPLEPDLVCEQCASDRMVLQGESSRPSWRDLLGYGS